MTVTPCAEVPFDAASHVTPGACVSRRNGTHARAGQNDQEDDLPLDCTVYGPDAPVNGLEALAAEWNQVLEHSRCETFFLTHEWQSTWWDLLGEGELWILAFRQRPQGRLVAIVPLYRLQHQDGDWAGLASFHLVGCIEVSDFLDAIVVQGWEEEVYRGLLRWLASDEAPHWDRLDLCNLPEASLTYRVLPPLAEAVGYRTDVFQEDTAPRIQLPLRYDDYLLNQVDKKQRHEIRRKQRRAERETRVEFSLVDKDVTDEQLDAELDEFIRLQRLSSPDKQEFMTPEMRRFFKQMARRMLDAGYLRLAFLNLDGQRAATLFAFEYKGAFLLYNSGYDTEDLAQYSPGWVLLAYLIQYAIAAGCHLFDFLQGDEEYKYRFGSQDYKVMRVIVQNQIEQDRSEQAQPSQLT